MDINKICPGCMKEVNDREHVGICPHCGYDFVNITTETHQLKPFTILAGKYLVGKVIGEGGFGITYLGMDLNLDIVLAIKEFYPNGFVTRESNHSTRVSMYSGKNEADVNKWREGFINEAKNLAKFSNLNGIVEVRDFFNENNTAYIVMEYVDGITLKKYLKENGGKISPERTFEMMEPIVRSLSKVHNAGMIHRDISPDNIMITKHGGMKLLDFGAAREFAGNAEKSLSIMLKPGYAPEEQYRSRGKQGPWSDVYALTATIYKCITGVTPVESMERMREDTLRMPSELGIKMIPQQEEAVKKGMAVYAENRIQNMDELYNILYKNSSPIQAGSVNKTKPETNDGRAKGAKLSEIKSESLDAIAANKNVILIGAGAIACIILIAFCVILIPKDKHTKTNDVAALAEGKTPYEETEAEETLVIEAATVNEAENDDISAIIDEVENVITDYNDIDQVTAALDKYLELARQYGSTGNLGEKVYRLFGVYDGLLVDRLDNCNSQEPSAALYNQMINDINTAVSYADNFRDYSIGVNIENIVSRESSIKNGYKQRIIANFDQCVNNEIYANGVVSRSELWSKLEGIKDTDLYDKENPEDALRQRYACALTLYTDSELEKLENVGDKIAKIYEVISDADYNPLLIYYLMSYGDNNAYNWYDEYLYYGYDDLYYLSDTEMKNFVYYYATESFYEYVRQNFREYMFMELGY